MQLNETNFLLKCVRRAPRRRRQKLSRPAKAEAKPVATGFRAGKFYKFCYFEFWTCLKLLFNYQN
ncbi:hypothetical protein HanHA89_Chr17g0686371 [Helianthus annuus]|nr:hypothetical protein HanHA89_Chr17g0686371 [Helianthus annuus]